VLLSPVLVIPGGHRGRKSRSTFSWRLARSRLPSSWPLVPSAGFCCARCGAARRASRRDVREGGLRARPSVQAAGTSYPRCAAMSNARSRARSVTSRLTPRSPAARRTQGHRVNCKRVQRLMRLMGLGTGIGAYPFAMYFLAKITGYRHDRKNACAGGNGPVLDPSSGADNTRIGKPAQRSHLGPQRRVTHYDELSPGRTARD
jgi:hypothetical protein